MAPGRSRMVRFKKGAWSDSALPLSPRPLPVLQVMEAYQLAPPHARRWQNLTLQAHQQAQPQAQQLPPPAHAVAAVEEARTRMAVWCKALQVRGHARVMPQRAVPWTAGGQGGERGGVAPGLPGVPVARLARSSAPCYAWPCVERRDASHA